jgi:hypothetical protein
VSSGDFKALFKWSAGKRVSKTDKAKSAFVLTKEQVEVFATAGLSLQLGNPKPTVRISVLGETGTQLESSYYLSERKGSGRTPEPRVGKQFIGDWLNVGDKVFIATDGERLVAWRNRSRLEAEVLEDEAVAKVSTKRLLAHLATLSPLPVKQKVTRQEFKRSRAVIELVLRRAKGQCEYPGCTSQPVITTSGNPFLEVHHIEWLRNGGRDHPDNAVALCPRCHRAQHHDMHRHQLKEELAAALKAMDSTWALDTGQTRT